MKGDRKGKLTKPIPGQVAEVSADYVGPGVLASSPEAKLVLGGHDQSTKDLLSVHSNDHGVNWAVDYKGDIIARAGVMGAVCLTFDDCYSNQRDVLNYMTHYHQRGTLFVTDVDVGGNFGLSVGPPDCFTYGAALGFQRKGHEIGHHTKNHVSMATSSFATQAAQLDDFTTMLTNNGIDVPTSFAYPFGYYNRDTDSALVSRGFRVRRYAGTMTHSRNTAGNTFMVNAAQIASDSVVTKPPGFMNIRDIKAWVDRCATQPVILVLFCHLGDSYQYPNDNEPTVAEMEGLLDYIYAAGVPCLTLKEAFGGFNMLAGGGFESVYGGADSSYDGWNLENYSAGVTISNPTTTPLPGLGGTRALKVELTDVGDFCYIGQRVPIHRPGDTYHYSCHYKITGSVDPATYVSDDFSDNASNSWGTADTGGAWTAGVIGRAADADKAGGVGTIVIPDTTNVDQLELLNAMTIRKDYDVYVKFKFDKWPQGANLAIKLVGRYTDATHYVYGRCLLGLVGISQLEAFYRNGGAEVSYGSAVTTVYENRMFGGTGMVDNHWYGLRFQFNGTRVRGKLWADDYEHEQDQWQYDVTNASAYNTAGVAGIGLTSAAGISNSPVTVSFDNYSMTQPDPNNAGIRLQIYEIDQTGKTVLLTSGEQHKYNTDWRQLTIGSPVTVDNDTSHVELRIDCRALAANFYVDNVVFDLNRNQPQGPLG